LFFDPVKVLDLAQDKAGVLRNLFARFVEVAPGVRPASRQSNRVAALFNKGAVSGVAIALQRATKVHGYDII
jgi:hypothetical protein